MIGRNRLAYKECMMISYSNPCVLIFSCSCISSTSQGTLHSPSWPRALQQRQQAFPHLHVGLLNSSSWARCLIPSWSDTITTMCLPSPSTLPPGARLVSAMTVSCCLPYLTLLSLSESSSVIYHLMLHPHIWHLWSFLKDWHLFFFSHFIGVVSLTLKKKAKYILQLWITFLSSFWMTNSLSLPVSILPIFCFPCPVSLILW